MILRRVESRMENHSNVNQDPKEPEPLTKKMKTNLDTSPNEPQDEQITRAKEMKKKNRVLLLDNYDSFTYNLYQYLAELGAEVTVIRNDQITLQEIETMAPDRILISPGPGHPSKDAGICTDVIKHFAGRIPIGGICMGMQCMFEVFGGTVGNAGEIVHGKQGIMDTDGLGWFQGLPTKGLKAVRYHSLCGIRDTLPDELEVTAHLQGGSKMIMGVRHKKYPIEGVQFHPESILTEDGMQMMRNFLNM